MKNIRERNFIKNLISAALFVFFVYIATVINLFKSTGKVEWNIFKSTALPKFIIFSGIAIILIILLKLFKKIKDRT